MAQTANVRGIILDEEQQPIAGVAIHSDHFLGNSDENGFYSIDLNTNHQTELIFSHIGYKSVRIKMALQPGESLEFNPVMSVHIEQIGQVIITASGNRQIDGSVKHLSPETIRRIPGANAGVENLLRSLPGVNSNNELSTQYNVRGGNFDENLVYVNGIEVYRPFLIRSGQQEGLSFINTDLISNIAFSAGGFQAKYGDRMSSVLDITYREPEKFGIGAEASLLGGSIFFETASKDGSFTALVGARYRDNRLLVNSKQTETNYNPVFADVQGLISYRLNPQLKLSFFGNLSTNRYNYEPLTRQTNFGTIAEPMALVVYYQGQEKDRYNTRFGALQADYHPGSKTRLNFTGSVYHTTEQEYFDILAQYRLGEVNSDIGSEDLGQVGYTTGIGSQLNHGRNLLDGLIISASHKGSHDIEGNLIEWGIRYTHENFRDRLQEYEIIDSAGFSIRPPLPQFQNDQPYSPYSGELEAYQNIQAQNDVNTDRIAGFIQWSKRFQMNAGVLQFNAGLRTQYWNVNDGHENSSQMIWSPRAQISYKPDSGADMVFRMMGGLYQQPPFYRELRDSTGTVRPHVKAQSSWHIVAGHDIAFKIWKRPFKLTSELYYKNLWDVNPYTLENVRIRYRATNNAKAYAYGADLRLNGEFVEGTDSWFSVGYMRTEENIDGQGFIPRPTDQRLKFALLFQDYVPTIPNLRLYLNAVYNTGVPGGSPSYADPYDYQFRLPDYKRVDLGINYVFTDARKRYPKGHWLYKFKELYAGCEIFNIFDIRNSITNTWVRDVYSKRQYAIPNYMTGRVFNVKLGMKF
ncbi:TonB-dependent receptor [Robertkochia solimangrovi]|uniref:TonB-dependent receptor n=1 Tax=Robertkochia solimangrovi TaxID=2213046 RepID=UPI001F54B134|nr:TonB-dependent receptor plug domain-containing protein [Robertkochia solimangrovi]